MLSIKRPSRDGRFIDTIGHVDPLRDPAIVTLDEEKALKWLGQGAQPTDTARALLKKHGIMDRFEAEKLASRQAK